MMKKKFLSEVQKSSGRKFLQKPMISSCNYPFGKVFQRLSVLEMTMGKTLNRYERNLISIFYCDLQIKPDYFKKRATTT